MPEITKEADESPDGLGRSACIRGNNLEWGLAIERASWGRGC